MPSCLLLHERDELATAMLGEPSKTTERYERNLRIVLALSEKPGLRELSGFTASELTRIDRAAAEIRRMRLDMGVDSKEERPEIMATNHDSGLASNAE